MKVTTMIKQNTQLVLFTSLLLCAFSTNALGTLVINVGDHTLLPNTANQEIQIFVTSDAGDLVHGMNLQAGIGDGRDGLDEPVFQGGGAFSGIDFSGSIWETAPSAISGFGFPAILFDESQGLASLGFTNSGATVLGNGLIATLIVDTSGILLGSGPFDLYLDEQFGLEGTTFTTVAGPLLTPTINNGSITIAAVPEPSPALFGLVGFAGFAVILCFRRLRKLVPARN